MSMGKWGLLGTAALVALAVGWLAWVLWMPHHLVDGLIRALVLFAAWSVVHRFREKRGAVILVISWWVLYVVVMLPMVSAFLARLGVRSVGGGG